MLHVIYKPQGEAVRLDEDVFRPMPRTVTVLFPRSSQFPSLSSRLLLSEPAALSLPQAPQRAQATRDYLLGDEAAGEGSVDFMGEAEGRQQLPAALAEGILHEGITFVTAGKLFPFVIGGIWEECKPHVPETFQKPLAEAAARSRGRM